MFLSFVRHFMLELWIKNMGYNTVMNLILIFKPKICNKNIIKSNQAIIKRITRSVINVVINTKNVKLVKTNISSFVLECKDEILDFTNFTSQY